MSRCFSQRTVGLNGYGWRLGALRSRYISSTWSLGYGESLSSRRKRRTISSLSIPHMYPPIRRSCQRRRGSSSPSRGGMEWMTDSSRSLESHQMRHNRHSTSSLREGLLRPDTSRTCQWRVLVMRSSWSMRIRHMKSDHTSRESFPFARAWSPRREER